MSVAPRLHLVEPWTPRTPWPYCAPSLLFACGDVPCLFPRFAADVCTAPPHRTKVALSVAGGLPNVRAAARKKSLVSQRCSTFTRRQPSSRIPAQIIAPRLAVHLIDGRKVGGVTLCGRRAFQTLLPGAVVSCKACARSYARSLLYVDCEKRNPGKVGIDA